MRDSAKNEKVCHKPVNSFFVCLSIPNMLEQVTSTTQSINVDLKIKENEKSRYDDDSWMSNHRNRILYYSGWMILYSLFSWGNDFFIFIRNGTWFGIIGVMLLFSMIIYWVYKCKCTCHANKIKCYGICVFISSVGILSYSPFVYYGYYIWEFYFAMLHINEIIAPGLYGILLFFEIWFKAFNGNKSIRIKYTIMILIVQSIIKLMYYSSFKPFWHQYLIYTSKKLILWPGFIGYAGILVSSLLLLIMWVFAINDRELWLKRSASMIHLY